MGGPKVPLFGLKVSVKMLNGRLIGSLYKIVIECHRERNICVTPTDFKTESPASISNL